MQNPFFEFSSLVMGQEDSTILSRMVVVSLFIHMIVCH